MLPGVKHGVRKELRTGKKPKRNYGKKRVFIAAAEADVTDEDHTPVLSDSTPVLGMLHQWWGWFRVARSSSEGRSL